MRIATPISAGWSKLSIALHWLIVGLLVVQMVDNDWMIDMWRATRRGTEIDQTTLIGGWTHIVVGTLILAATALRLWDRMRHGRPAHPTGQPAWATRFARVTHALLYALLLAMPAAGLAAWFGGVGAMAELHGLLWPPLLILAGLHIVGAFVQHFWFRSDVLRRIVRPV